MSPLAEWIALRYDPTRVAWIQVGKPAHAATAGDAFRAIVLPPPNSTALPQQGEYRVLSLEDSAHIAIEFNLKDLDYKDPVAA